MQDKARLLVTHQLQYLPHADRVVVLDAGRIVVQVRRGRGGSQGALGVGSGLQYSAWVAASSGFVRHPPGVSWLCWRGTSRMHCTLPCTGVSKSWRLALYIVRV